jgi:ribose-phosphate pyrophosphokinase
VDGSFVVKKEVDMSTLRIFSVGSNVELAKEICTYLEIELSQLSINTFSNGNLSIQILNNVREKDVFVIQSFTEPVNRRIIELFITVDALRSASAKRITAVIPYFSYSRSDKKDAPRISIVARLMADLIKEAGANRVLTMDLHSDSVHGFFSMPVDHLTAIPIIAEHIQQNMDLTSAVAIATDAGGAKRVGRFVNYLNIPMAIIDKRRINDVKVEQGLVVGNVKDRDAIIFDDEISTGGTLMATAKTLTEAGVRKMLIGVTHPVFCGDAITNIVKSKLERVIVTNTVHISEEKKFDRLTVLSVAPLFAEAIKRIHTGESVGALFK